jgi:hypothetical protein
LTGKEKAECKVPDGFKLTSGPIYKYTEILWEIKETMTDIDGHEAPRMLSLSAAMEISPIALEMV